LADDQKTLVDLTKKRADDKSDFQRSQAQHVDIINAIDAVVAELRKLVGSISGQGRPASVEEIAQEKRDAAYAKLHKSFLQITKDEEEIAMFIQMATKADQEALQKLISLLLKLKESAIKSYNNDKDAEKKSKATFKELKALLNEDMKKLEAMITTSKKHLKEYKDKVAKLAKEINVKTQIRNNKIKEKTATIAERELKENQYNEEKAERADEIRVVQKLQKIVKERLANMSKYLKEHTGA